MCGVRCRLLAWSVFSGSGGSVPMHSLALKKREGHTMRDSENRDNCGLVQCLSTTVDWASKKPESGCSCQTRDLTIPVLCWFSLINWCIQPLVHPCNVWDRDSAKTLSQKTLVSMMIQKASHDSRRNNIYMKEHHQILIETKEDYSCPKSLRYGGAGLNVERLRQSVQTQNSAWYCGDQSVISCILLLRETTLRISRGC